MPLNEKDLTRPLSSICKSVLADVDQKLKSPMPTPPKGMLVGWVNSAKYKQGRGGNPAIVLERMGAGEVSLQVFGIPGPTESLKTRCMYTQHPDALGRPGTPGSSYGFWYYLEVEDNPKFKPPSEHYEWHIERLHAKRQACLSDEVERQKKAIEREQVDEAIKSQQQAGMAAVK